MDDIEAQLAVKQDIVIVWLKRDLRLIDHEALYYAQQQDLPVLLVYCFEPSVMQYPDSDIRHWRFVYQSLQDMQQKLRPFTTEIAIFHQEALAVFHQLQSAYSITSLLSHEEIGNKITYDRDLVIQQFCRQHHIVWKEFQHNGVVRRLSSRKHWEKLWKQKMEEEPKENVK